MRTQSRRQCRSRSPVVLLLVGAMGCGEPRLSAESADVGGPSTTADSGVAIVDGGRAPDGDAAPAASLTDGGYDRDAGYACPGGSCVGWVTSKALGAPAARSEHVAVWTGSEMIVWGGGNFQGYVNSGGRYEPVSDRWNDIATTAAPTARGGHTAIWTGTEMIVWGGGDEHTYGNGARYSPASDTWTAVSLTGAPSARAGHTAIWTGTEMIVWGGDDGGRTGDTYRYRSDGARYNPTTGTWTALPTAGAPSGRVQHSAIWTGSEMIVWGGHGDASDSTGGRYNPTTNTWLPMTTTSAPAPRRGHSAVWTGSEMIVWGGYHPAVAGGDATGARYSPAADTWTALPKLPKLPAFVGRSSHTAVIAHGNTMIVWGGHDYAELADGARLDVATNAWTVLPAVGTIAGRYNHTAVWTGSTMIVWGGYTTSIPGFFADVAIYAP